MFFRAGIFWASKDGESAATLRNRNDKEQCIAPKRTSENPSLSFMMSINNRPKLTLLYDGACPFCRREIAWMSKKNTKGQLSFEDITAPSFDPAIYGLTRAAVMEVIHGIDDDGHVIKKVEVFIKAYELLGLGWLVAPLSWPLIRSIANRAYELFARYRVSLGNLFGRVKCDSDRCHSNYSNQSFNKKSK